MRTRYFLPIIGLFVGLNMQAQDTTAQGDYIMLVDALDEPEFYCFDLAGWGQNVQIDDPLQTHTCKTRNAADQMFTLVANRVEVVGHDRCLQVAGSTGTTLAGSSVLARPCVDDSPLQDISMDESGLLRVGETGLCIVAGAESEAAGGPSHLWRTLTLQSCESTETSLATWQVGMN